jgi:uncharacterized protein (TIGR02599 family)
MNTYPRNLSWRAAFTLVELMVSLALISVLMLIVVQITNQTSATWRYTATKAEQFREARTAFDTMTRRISQATLNTYWDYDDPVAPKQYIRQSELRFISGPMQNGPATNQLDSKKTQVRPGHGIFFQAPFGYNVPGPSGAEPPNYMGLETLLNTWGYYLEVGDDSRFRPNHITKDIVPLRVRSRLMEFMQPSSQMNIYKWTSGTPGAKPNLNCDKSSNADYLGWFRGAFVTPPAGANQGNLLSHVLAENVIALSILPKLSPEDAKEAKIAENRRETILAPNYSYHSAVAGPALNETTPLLKGVLNTKHQLPPVVQVTMIAIDELSAQRANLRLPTDDPFGVQNANFLTNASKQSEDLLYNSLDSTPSASSIEKRLIDRKLNYRIFSTNVHLRGAKWSKAQTN